MEYPDETFEILLWLGYSAEADFEWDPVNKVLLWFHADPKPTPEFIDGKRLQFWKRTKRIAARSWAERLNIRSFEDDRAGSSLDNHFVDVRQATRAMINNFAAEEGLSARVSNAEAKAAFATRPRLNLIQMGGEARGEMKDAINALTDADAVAAYVVDDATAAAVHAAAYPDADPTLAALLAQYPEDFE